MPDADVIRFGRREHGDVIPRCGSSQFPCDHRTLNVMKDSSDERRERRHDLLESRGERVFGILNDESMFLPLQCIPPLFNKGTRAASVSDCGVPPN